MKTLTNKQKATSIIFVAILCIASALLFFNNARADEYTQTTFTVATNNSSYGSIWEGDNEIEDNETYEKDSEYTAEFSVDENNNLHLKLYEVHSKLTFSDEDNNMSDSPLGNYLDQTEYTFSPAANDDCYFTNWTFQGTALEKNTTYNKNHDVFNNSSFAANFAQAQYSIAGTVTNNVTNAPVEGALVSYVDSSGVVTKGETDELGNYKLILQNNNIGSLTIAADSHYIKNIDITDTASKKTANVQLTNIGESVTLSGNVSGKDAQDISVPLGGVDIFYVTEAGTCYAKSSATTEKENTNSISVVGTYSMKVPKSSAGVLIASKEYYETDSVDITAEQTASALTKDLTLKQTSDCINIIFRVDDKTKGSLMQPGDNVSKYQIFSVSIPVVDAKNAKVTYKIDEYTGMLTIYYGNNKSYVVQVSGEKGYAYYDWTFKEFSGENIPRSTTGTLTSNTLLTASFVECGSYLATSESPCHAYFSLTTKTTDYKDTYKDDAAEMRDTLYEGTKVTVEKDSIYFEYQKDSYHETYRLQAVPNSKGDFSKWTINDKEIDDTYTYVVKKGDKLNIEALYKVKEKPTPTPDPDPKPTPTPDPESGDSNTASGSSSTGDATNIAIILGIIVSASAVMGYSLKRRNSNK